MANGGLAARVSGWQQRMGSVAGPLSASGESSNGNPVMAELKISGAWTDVTSYVMVRDDSGHIAINRGQPDEYTVPDKSTCDFLLNNRDGRFSPRNPSSPYYGYIGRNTEFRVSVPNGGYKNYRFWGEVSSWPQKWDTTGTDIWVEAEASGPFRRLSQGHAPVNSVLYTAFTDGSLGAMLEYWPMEDIATSTTLASALPGHSAMTITGTPQLAAFSQFPGSDLLPIVSANSFRGGVTPTGDPTATQVRCLLYIPPEGALDNKVIFRIAQDDVAFTVAYWELTYNVANSSLSLYGLGGDNTFLGVALNHTFDVRGKLLYVSVELQENGPNITRTINILPVEAPVAISVSDTSNTVALSQVISVSICPDSINAAIVHNGRGITNGSVGHVSLQNVITPMTILGARLDTIGEPAGLRAQRVCSEHAIPFNSIGTLSNTEAMGPQDKLKPLDLLQECAAADMGILYENPSAFGLGYRTRESLYTQDAALTLTYKSWQLAQIPIPTDDDLFSKNSISVARTNGNTQLAELTTGSMSTADPPVGIGVYGDSVTVNIASDTQLLGQANWRLHTGTVDEARYPQISVNLAHPQFATNPALKAAVLSLRVGDRIVLTGPLPQQAPDDVSVIVRGFNETINHFQHQLTFNCSPESPWRVGIVEDLVYGRLDTNGSTLSADLTSTATSVGVATTSGPLWSSDPTGTPFDIRVSGEVMTVTTVGQVLNANPGFETDLSDWNPINSTVTRSNVQAKFGAWSGLITSTAGASPRAESGHAAVTVGALYQATGWFYAPAVLVSGAEIDVNWFDAAHAYLSTSSIFAAPTVGAWLLYSGTATAPASAAFASIAGVLSGSPGAGFQLYVDDLKLVPVASYTSSPQTLTVTRSVNTIVKAQTAGTAVSLAHPAIIAL